MYIQTCDKGSLEYTCTHEASTGNFKRHFLAYTISLIIQSLVENTKEKRHNYDNLTKQRKIFRLKYLLFWHNFVAANVAHFAASFCFDACS